MWPAGSLPDLLPVLHTLSTPFALPAPLLTQLRSYSPARDATYLPLLCPIAIAGPSVRLAAGLAYSRVKSAEGFVRGFISSSYQGSRTMHIPPEMTAAKGVPMDLDAQLVNTIKDNWCTPDTVVESKFFRPIGGSAREVWECRCLAAGGVFQHVEGYECKCLMCRLIDERSRHTSRPSRLANDPVPRPFLISSSHDHSL